MYYNTQVQYFIANLGYSHLFQFPILQIVIKIYKIMQGKKQKWFLKALLVYFAGNNNLEALNELLKFMQMSHFCGVSHR